MKLLGTPTINVILELDATDCCQLADAIGYALGHDVPGNVPHLEAMHTALRACSIVCAHDTASDSRVEPADRLAHVRKVWGPDDTTAAGHPSILTDPA